ncbi:MAG: PQQ-binding-like beta-propeller repeat protein [Chitinophagaceae bacterium]|nr:PQQ-binding-like beta-propeller repeat protein [Chitinophagaceae bacterium]MCB9047376.1 PQQ-binding-like beta-propeller repeat protein [Chitinophagales bacterium]
MRLSWIRNIFLFSTVVILATSCSQPEFSKDEPLIEAKRPAVYISGQNNFLFAIDPNTGEKVWERFFGVNNIKQEPIVLGDYVMVNSDLGVVVLGVDKGNKLDTITSVDGHQLAGYISGEGLTIYSGTTDNFIIAYNYGTKSAVWGVQQSYPTAMSSAGSFYGNLFIVHINTTLYAMDKTQGASLAWSNPIGPVSNPVVSPPNIYAMNPTTGTLYAIDLETGASSWNLPTGSPVSGPVIVYGGYIIFGSDDNYLYCIDSISHTPRWTYKTTERIKGGAYCYDQAVYFGGYDHYVYSLNIVDGALNWRYRTGALINGSPVAYDGTVYFPSYDQHLYAFDTSGSLKWKYKVNAPIDMSPVYNALNNKVLYPAPSGLSNQ